jgi:hypothetical protein
MAFNYHHDWGLNYDTIYPLNYRVKLTEASEQNHILDSLSTFEIKEFKPWKIIYGRDEPWERKFYARTTPFGVRLMVSFIFVTTLFHLYNHYL